MHGILAARTDFSIGEAILDAKKLVSRATELGEKAVGVTDTMSVTSLISVASEAKKADLKPLVGCRLRLVDDLAWRKSKEVKKEPYFYPTVYALTEKGLQAIYRLLTIANQEDHFYFAPRLSFDDLFTVLGSVTGEDLVFTTGDQFSLLQHPNAAEILKTVNGFLRPDSVFASLVAVDAPYWDALNVRAAAVARAVGIETLLIRPAFYLNEGDAAAEVMGAIVAGNKGADPWHRSPFTRDFHPFSRAELAKQAAGVAKRMVDRGVSDAGAVVRSGLLNTEKLVSRVSYVWQKSAPSLPKMADDEFAALKAECLKGWSKRFRQISFGHQPTPSDLATVYKDRLHYELTVLKKLGFSGYFLLVQDIVQFAKTNGILVGPGRGSVGGSLVAYLMGITDCDPIRFNLLFERFINPDRIDLPDADLDFMSERRHEVIEYLIAKYGSERVAGVSNFGTLGAASTMRDVSKFFGIPESEFRVSKFVPSKHGVTAGLEEAADEVGEIAQFREKWRTQGVWDVMLSLEGNMRNMSQHAAGIVVAGCDIVERAVVEKRKDTFVCNWDKRVIEDQGLIKVDILGLNTLDHMALATLYVKERTGKTLDLGAIPLDDPKVLEAFAEARTVGIFQFESGGMRKLLKNMAKLNGTLTFDEITAATALYRPGPMEAGLMDSFWKRKQGLEDIEYDHPLLEPVLKTTFGVLVYQEQVMQASRVIAGYSGADADKLRKIMGKKLPEEMKKERGKFVDGCVKTIGCDADWAGRLFDKIEGFAGYGFNLSHSVEYTLISYQMMYLKVYHPVEFFAAALSLMPEEKLPAVLTEAKRLNITIDVPDINHSTNRFEILTDTRLVIPFQRVKGLSERAALAIIEARDALPGLRFDSKKQFVEAVNKRLVNSAKQEVLDKIGAFALVEPTQPRSDDPARLRDQIELIPGLIDAAVPVDRELDKNAKLEIARIIKDYQSHLGPGAGNDGIPVKPHFGREASFMLVTDCPNRNEEENGVMGMDDRSTAIPEALASAELTRADCYWTGLVKRPKAGKQVTPDEAALYLPYLQREIQALKPPVIVLCGSQAVRTFLPDFKGKASDAAGTIVYSKEFDANLVIGFNVGEIFYAPEKQDDLNRVFAVAADLVKN